MNKRTKFLICVIGIPLYVILLFYFYIPMILMTVIIFLIVSSALATGLIE